MRRDRRRVPCGKQKRAGDECVFEGGDTIAARETKTRNESRDESSLKEIRQNVHDRECHRRAGGFTRVESSVLGFFLLFSLSRLWEHY